MKAILNGMKLIVGMMIVSAILVTGYLLGYDDRIATNAVEAAHAATETANGRVADLEAHINAIRNDVAAAIASN